MEAVRWGAESLAELVEEVRRASADMSQGDARTNARIDQISKALDGVLIRLNRPGADRSANDNDDLRKDARELCVLKHQLTVPKNDGGSVYMPSPSDSDDALAYRRGLQNLWRVGDANRLDATVKKSMTSFSFGTNQFLMPP